MSQASVEAEEQAAPSWAEAEPGGTLFDMLAGLSFSTLSDAELLAAIRGARRHAAASHGLEYGLQDELYRRRVAQDIEDGCPDERVGRHAADELAVEIGITVRAAERQLDRAARLAELPRTMGALKAGRISEWHAQTIADFAGITELPEGVAEVIEEAMLQAVGSMHTGKLRRLGEQLLRDLAPEVYEERRKESHAGRRVEVKDDAEGTATLQACQVNKAIAHRVYDQLRADAQALQRLGDDRNLGVIMADLMLRRALGEIDDPHEGFNPDNDGDGGATPDDAPADDDGGGATVAADDEEPVPWPEAPPPDSEPDPESDGDVDGADGEASGWLRMGAMRRRRVRPGDAVPLPDIAPGDEGRCGRDDACDRCGPPADGVDHGHLRVRLIHQGGTSLVELKRDAAVLLRQGVCVSITDRNGNVIQHGSGHYVPSPGMRKIIQQRHIYCAFPGCLRRAHKAEIDHSEAWPEGDTCGCNISPLCKRHHIMKHSPRWQFEQPEPGLIEWTTPGGRRFRVDNRPR